MCAAAVEPCVDPPAASGQPFHVQPTFMVERAAPALPVLAAGLEPDMRSLVGLDAQDHTLDDRFFRQLEAHDAGLVGAANDDRPRRRRMPLGRNPAPSESATPAILLRSRWAVK